MTGRDLRTETMKMPTAFRRGRESCVAALPVYTRIAFVVFLATALYVYPSEKSSVVPTIDLIASSQNSDRVMQMWTRSCALCHIDGNGGAPVIGNQQDWAARIGQGLEILVARTLEGYNKMPPLGYCMACSKADFREMIEFMVEGVVSEREPE